MLGASGCHWNASWVIAGPLVTLVTLHKTPCLLFTLVPLQRSPRCRSDIKKTIVYSHITITYHSDKETHSRGRPMCTSLKLLPGPGCKLQPSKSHLTRRRSTC